MPMQDRLYKLGGASFVVSGGLLLAKNILEILAGLPPPGGPELVTWAVSRRALFASAVEVFFFAVVLLIPATVALYEVSSEIVAPSGFEAGCNAPDSRSHKSSRGRTAHSSCTAPCAPS
jgi:hypothetical protein